MSIKKLDTNLAVAEKAIDSSIIIIDVRERDEFLQKKLSNSINIPINNIIKTKDIIDFEQYNIFIDSKIFVHCASGARSENASKHLVNLGFSDVTNIGGINNIK